MNEKTIKMISLYKVLRDYENDFSKSRKISSDIAALKTNIEKGLLKAEDLPTGTIKFDKLCGNLAYGAKISIGNSFKHWIRVSSGDEIMRIDDRSICKIVQLEPDRFLVLYSETDTGNPIKLYLSHAELISSFHREKRQD